GYAGVVALLVLFLAPLRFAFLRRPRGPRGDVLLGLGVDLLLFCVHCYFEWAWRLTEISYLYFMNIALVAAVAQPARQALAGAWRGGGGDGVRRGGGGGGGARAGSANIPRGVSARGALQW